MEEMPFGDVINVDAESHEQSVPVEPGGAQTGDNTCPDCAGSGRSGDATCSTCGGDGTVVEPVGDA